MNKPIEQHELDAERMTPSRIDETNCAEHYRDDVLAMRRRLTKYDKNDPKYALTHSILLDEFVNTLMDKYESFIEDLTDDMPENDLEIYADLEGREYDPDEN